MHIITEAGMIPRTTGICLTAPGSARLLNRSRRDYDRFWKYLIEEMFEFFFRFFKPRLVEYFDLGHIEFLDKEQGKMFPNNNADGKTRFVDKLVKVYRKNSPKRYVIFHIEVQGTANRHFPERMFEYFYRLRNRYRSPVDALAIVTGGGSGAIPKYERRYEETTISYTYPVYRIRHQSEKALLESNNPFAFVILIAQKGHAASKWADEQIIDYFGSLAATMESRNLPVKHLNMLYGFLNECISFANPENYQVFNHLLETITKRKNPMGLKEELMEAGRQEGRQEGIALSKKETIIELLMDGHYDVRKIASLLHVTKERVFEIKRLLALENRPV